MKNVLLLFCLMFSLQCIGGGKKSLRRELHRTRKEQDRLWRPCQNFEVRGTESRNPVGLFCTRAKGKSKIKDFCSSKDFNFFRDGTFILIDEDFL